MDVRAHDISVSDVPHVIDECDRLLAEFPRFDGAQQLRRYSLAPLQRLMELMDALRRVLQACVELEPDERLAHDWITPCEHWRQFMLTHDRLLMYEFRADIDAEWYDERLIDRAFYVQCLLCELSSEREWRTLTGAQCLRDYVHADALLMCAYDTPLVQMSVTQTLNNIRLLGSRWNELVYCAQLPVYVDALLLTVAQLVLYVHDATRHDGADFRTQVRYTTDDGSECVGYTCNRQLLSYAALLFRGFYRDLGSMERYVAVAGALQPRTSVPVSEAQYLRCVCWMVATAQQYSYEEAPPLLTEHYMQALLAPGEYHMHYVDAPSAFRSVPAVLKRHANYSQLADSSMEIPQHVVVRELTRSPIPRGEQQSVHLRFALAAHLQLVMSVKFATLDWDLYMVPAHQYLARVGELDQLEVDTPVLLSVFHQWQLFYNGSLYAYNDMVEAFVAWLLLVRAQHSHDASSELAAQGIDLRELYTAILDEPVAAPLQPAANASLSPPPQPPPLPAKRARVVFSLANADASKNAAAAAK